MDLQFGHYRLKRTERQVLGPQGPMDLSARSFDILTLLLDRPGEVVSKDALFRGGRGPAWWWRRTRSRFTSRR